MIARPACVALAAIAAVICAAMPAGAACQRLAYSVNDYGKDGPTKDAKDLLDKYIATWTKEKGIAKYTVGKKDVKCELFLNFIVFDEHTCQASALVCWGDGAGAPATPAATNPAPAPKPPAAKPPSAKKAQLPGSAARDRGRIPRAGQRRAEFSPRLLSDPCSRTRGRSTVSCDPVRVFTLASHGRIAAADMR